MYPEVLLFNPRSANHSHRIPNSILQVGAAIHGKYSYALVDGNMERNPWITIEKHLKSGKVKYFGCTVMPGPQLSQAIPYSKKIKEEYPAMTVIWGGYFASNQYKAVIQSGFVDFVVNGVGDQAFPALLDALENGQAPDQIRNLIFQKENEIILTSKENVLDYDQLPDLPYAYLDGFYPMEKYLGKSFLGKKTIAYHSSFGCPFTCSFCGIVPIYEARWKGKSARNIYKDLKYLKDTYGADAIEFHDNNFFVSEKRIVEFSELIKKEKMQWWGEGRIDTIDKFKDESLAQMRDAGCRMIFLGAESGNDQLLKQMDKGGTQNARQMKAFAARLQRFDIIPEYSFVLGFPAENEAGVMAQINRDIEFIKEIKSINPATEIIIYVYSPVPQEGSEMYEKVKAAGFAFPQKLEDWLEPAWLKFDLRKNPMTPWLKPYMIDRIRNFEAVLNAVYPTVSDLKLTSFQRKVIRLLGSLRYRTGFYRFPYEIKALQKFWLKYRQPEIEGFYLEQ